ncbi:nuclear transport factor 2 family protein [Patulibacter sp. NPDC049589]|uniref:nuclear transport factor 2 family protein n=1 Tax=Patulibacter sp. NPDC049589 TaxID=3154731 RepID=UPI00342F9320
MSPEDQLAVHAVIARYGHVLDTGGEPFATVFTADAEFVVALPDGTVSRSRGIRDVVTMLTGAPEDPRPRPDRPAFSHHTTNVEIVASTDDSCEVRSKYFRLGPPGVAIGQYLDTVVRTPDGWRIARRVTVPHGG